MPTPQFLTDLLQLLLDLAMPAAFCTLTAAGVSLRHEGGVNFHVSGRTGKWILWTVILLTLPQLLSWVAAQGISVPSGSGSVGTSWLATMESLIKNFVNQILQRNYQNPVTDVQKRTAGYIAQYLKAKKTEWETDVFAQRRRLAVAEESLTKKETKKAREEVRIATSKSQALLDRLADLRRTEPNKEDARIFPMMYAPVLISENGKTIIRPMRYACRLAGKPADYDRRFPGTYNARRDSLDDYWNKVYGRNHAVLVISGFYENVPLHLYEHRELAPAEKEKNLVLEFDPQPSGDMLVACLWDRWSRQGSPDLYSFAAITDEPTPEVAATGHQRTIITLEEQYLSEWLSPAQVSRERLEEILSEKETPYYVHQIAA